MRKGTGKRWGREGKREQRYIETRRMKRIGDW